MLHCFHLHLFAAELTCNCGQYTPIAITFYLGVAPALAAQPSLLPPWHSQHRAFTHHSSAAFPAGSAGLPLHPCSQFSLLTAAPLQPPHRRTAAPPHRRPPMRTCYSRRESPRRRTACSARAAPPRPRPARCPPRPRRPRRRPGPAPPRPRRSPGMPSAPSAPLAPTPGQPPRPRPAPTPPRPHRSPSHPACISPHIHRRPAPAPTIVPQAAQTLPGPPLPRRSRISHAHRLSRPARAARSGPAPALPCPLRSPSHPAGTSSRNLNPRRPAPPHPAPPRPRSSPRFCPALLRPWPFRAVPALPLPRCSRISLATRQHIPALPRAQLPIAPPRLRGSPRPPPAAGP